MRLSNLADYAVITMCQAALHCGEGRVSAAELATETGLPVPTVQKLVSRLTSAGLLRSTRGVGGGLKLARPAAAISLADIIEAVEGPIALTQCVDDARADCGLDSCCSVKPHWPIVNEALRGALSQVSLIRLAEVSARAKTPPCAIRPPAMLPPRLPITSTAGRPRSRPSSPKRG